MNAADLRHTAAAIAAVQRPDGCIPWFPGGHADPWDMIEAAMGMDVGGLHGRARRAYAWLAAKQAEDGSWSAAYRDGLACDTMVDANFCAYIATGAWHHYRATSDEMWLRSMWAVVEKAIDFTLDLQDPSGAILWARDAHYRPWPGALLTSSCSIYLSLRCALAAAAVVGEQRPDWELSLTALHRAIGHEADVFEDKDRFSMDWYYPVLCGAVTGSTARARLLRRWDEFVIEGRGVRCVRDRPWVTAGETAELVVALDCAGMTERALGVYSWLGLLRDADGAYWTGRTWPDGTAWPQEKPTWGSGAVLLAADALGGQGPSGGLFRGEGLPVALPLADRLPPAMPLHRPSC